VKDRTIIKTTKDETKVLEPKGIQEKIDEIVKKYDCGRSFIRPSGTEDIVRVYSESSTQKLANDLAIEVLALVYNELYGVGNLITCFE
jgi:phosphoacetylglucosamine mutase